MKDIKFNSTGKGMKDVKAVFVSDLQYKAGLYINNGEFYLVTKAGKLIAFDEKMKCDYSEGE